MGTVPVFRLDSLALAALLSLAWTHGASAAGSPGSATAKTLSAIGIARTADLDFGIVIPSAAAGTVSINAQTGTRTSAGGVTPVGGTVSTGNFIGAATAGRVVTLALTPSPSIVLNRVGGGASMTVNQLRVSVDGAAPQPFGPNHTIGPSGAILFQVGGRLNIGANQLEGSYEATFSLTMDYQ